MSELTRAVDGSGGTPVMTRALQIPAPSAAALALARMPKDIAMEKNLARAPIFAAPRTMNSKTSGWETVGSLAKRDFCVFEPYGPLQTRDALLISHVIDQYASADCPGDRLVEMSQNEAARFSGYRSEGGKQRRLIQGALLRMRSTTFQHYREKDGRSESLTWGLVDWAEFHGTPAGSGVTIRVSEQLAALVCEGSLTYLNAETFAKLVDRNGYAARLWVFLESEKLPRLDSGPFSYQLFSAPTGQEPKPSHVPALADLLRIGYWKNRSRVVQEITKAASVLCELDPRYTLSVESARGTGMYCLRAKCGAGARSGRRVLAGSLPGTDGYGEGVPTGGQGGTDRYEAPKEAPANDRDSEVYRRNSLPSHDVITIEDSTVVHGTFSDSSATRTTKTTDANVDAGPSARSPSVDTGRQTAGQGDEAARLAKVPDDPLAAVPDTPGETRGQRETLPCDLCSDDDLANPFCAIDPTLVRRLAFEYGRRFCETVRRECPTLPPPQIRRDVCAALLREAGKDSAIQRTVSPLRWSPTYFWLKQDCGRLVAELVAKARATTQAVA